MASKTFAQLASAADVQDADLLASYRGTGPLKSVTAAIIYTYFAAKLGSTTDGISVGTANTAADYITLKPTDYGAGKPGVFFSKATSTLVWNITVTDGQGSPTLGEIDFTLSLLKVNGALTVTGAVATGALTVTGAASVSAGFSLTGSTKQNVQAVAALNLDLSASDFFTKSISANSTFTFSNPTASTGQGFLLLLTVTSAAVPTWPASVKWSSGSAPIPGNGAHLFGFVTFDGGTTWVGNLGPSAIA